MAVPANELLHEAAISHSVDFSQYSEGVAYRIVALLNRSDAELSARIVEALERIDAATFTVERMESLIQSVCQVNADAYKQIGRQLSAEMATTAAYESAFQAAMLEGVLPNSVFVRFGVAAVNADQIYAAAIARPFQGRLLSGWASKVEADRMALIREQIRQGYVQNETTDQIVRRIRGTRAEKYTDGIINRSRKELQGVVHTALSHTAAVAREQFYEANSDLIAAQIWTSTLDLRTSVDYCIPRDGKQYTNGKEPKPIGHSLPWVGGPGRIHFRCRSCSRPRLKTFRELGIELDDFSISDRASMDGAVGGDLTYVEWLKKQSAARQDEVVGPKRGAMMRAGEIPFDSFYTPRGRWVTLQQLQERDARNYTKTSR